MYNIDEIGVITVIEVPKVIYKLGQKEVEPTASSENGDFMTFQAIINSVRNFVLLFSYFPETKVRRTFLRCFIRVKIY